MTIARTSQAAALVASSPPKASPRTSMLVALVSCGPPQAKYAEHSQSAALVAISAGVKAVPRTSQIVALVAYATGVPDQSRSLAWSYVLDGHTFYVLNLGDQGTFVYDMDTAQWCKFETQGYGQWNFLNGTMWQQGRIIGGDSLTDQVWELNPTALLDEGWRDIAHVCTGGLSVRSRTFVGCSALRISASAGLLDEVNGATLNMRFSDDQENTWSDYFTLTLTEADFGGEIAYRSLGSFMAPGRVFELSDSGGLIRIDGVDAMLDGFDNDQQSQE